MYQPSSDPEAFEMNSNRIRRLTASRQGERSITCSVHSVRVRLAVYSRCQVLPPSGEIQT